MRVVLVLVLFLLAGSASAADKHKRKRTSTNQPAIVTLSDQGVLRDAIVRVRSPDTLTLIVGEKKVTRVIRLTDVVRLKQTILDKGMTQPTDIAASVDAKKSTKTKAKSKIKPSPWQTYRLSLLLKGGETVTGVLAVDMKLSVQHQAGKLSKRVAHLNKGGQAMWEMTRDPRHNGAELENRQAQESLQQKIRAMQAKSRVWKTYTLHTKATGKPGASLSSLRYIKTIDFRPRGKR